MVTLSSYSSYDDVEHLSIFQIALQFTWENGRLPFLEVFTDENNVPLVQSGDSYMLKPNMRHNF